MTKTIILKLIFAAFTLLISINLFELFPQHFFTLDFFTQLSLWLICIGFYFSIGQKNRAIQSLQPSPSDEYPNAQSYATSIVLLHWVSGSIFLFTFLVKTLNL